MRVASKWSYKSKIGIFILPAFIVYTVIVIYPILQTLYRSLFDWDGIGSGTYIGFENYTRLYEDPLFMISLKNGLIFAGLILVYQLTMGTILSLIMISKRKIFAKRLFKTSYFIPVVLSATVVSQLWLFLYNTDRGVVNKLFEMLNINYTQNWLGDTTLAIFAIAFVNAWQYMGYQFSLIYTGVKSIPETYYEAALIDGASSFTAHRVVTLPLLADVYKFCIILSITGGLKAFTEMYLMTNGGPADSTFTFSMMMFKSAFILGEYGYGCAISIILVLQCLLFMLIVNRIFARSTQQ
ncbi:sugar ABC transporter permease [Paenibacillus sp. ACRRY]|nr:sugar ABC transporter permease [Paenibacillus sp. ACRRY]MCG7384668.1 sugar ABC transporter permease [Paenibacillus sp. ACRRY]